VSTGHRSPLAASVIMTVRHEPPDRLAAAVAALAAQTGLDGPIEVVIAVPPAGRDAVAALRPVGAVAAVRTVANPGGARSAGLNRATRAARAGVVVRVDARSRVAPDHVARCVARLAVDPSVGVVGGGQRPVAAVSAGARGAGIARALTNPWVLGGAAYRRRDAAGPVDTVYLGAFRRRQLLDLGGFDERLDANEDFELCARYRAHGLTVWLEEGLSVAYEPRGRMGEVWDQYVAFGRSKVHFWRLTEGRPNRRQQVALAAPVVAAVGAAVVVAVAPRPALVAALLLGAGGLAALAVDSRAEAPRATPAVRAWSVLASAAVVVGWLSGIAVELVRSPAPTFGVATSADHPAPPPLAPTTARSSRPAA